MLNCKIKHKSCKPRNKFLLGCFLAMIFFISASSDVFASEITVEEMIELTNRSRIESGLESLSVNSKLVQAAYLKADDMFKFDYFEHTSPAGIDPWHWIELAGYDYYYAGENLAIDFITAGGVHRALMESSSHRDNILNSRFKEIGVAVLEGEFENSNSTIVVEMFALPFNYNKNKNEADKKTEDEEIKIEEIEITTELETKPETEIEIKPKSDLDSTLNQEDNVSDITPNISKKPASKKTPDLLAMILVENNFNLIDSYLASNLYFKDNGEFLKQREEGVVLASAGTQPPEHSDSGFIYLLSLVLGIDLSATLVIIAKYTSI